MGIRFSLVVPLWNEGGNVVALVQMLAASPLVAAGRMAEAILVNNCSSDDTGPILDRLAGEHSWIRVAHLPRNLNYGGGIYEGCRYAREDFIAFIPGDLQYSAKDLERVVAHLELAVAVRGHHRVLAKGWRTRRLDPGSMQFVSSVYTGINNAVLGLRVHDVNGLPKVFHRDLLDALPQTRMVTFVFDAQLLFVALNLGWDIEEVEVTFHARRAGVSSWSGRRIRVYLTALRQLFQVRRLRNAPGVKLPPVA